MPLCGKCHRDATVSALFCAFCGAPIVPEQKGEPDPFIGQTFRGTYFIQQKVGGGGMGQVYKALHVTLDVPVALKILNKALLADPTVVQRFHREARAASRLRHPNVISVTDFGQTDDGTLFMAMEFVAGKSLGRLIAEEFPISEKRVVNIGAQILSALAEAHANQILHRDLKPENVMLEPRRDEPDSVKVLDFGIAKIQMPGDGARTLTQKGLVCGTPGYMSPEQWSDEELDARSDLYSVGVILYEMLTGKLPFEAQTPMEMVRKHLTERAAPPSARCPDHAVSPDLEALVMRAISADRDGRPASAEDMRADLLACVLLPSPTEARHTPRNTVALPRGSLARSTPGRTPMRRLTGALEGEPGSLVSPPSLRQAPAEARRTPAVTERLVTPGPKPRRPPSGPRVGQLAPTPAGRGTPFPRHEADENEEVGEELSRPPPPLPPRRLPLIAAALVAAVASLATAGFLYRRSLFPSPASPPEIARTDQLPQAPIPEIPARPLEAREPSSPGPSELPPPDERDPSRLEPKELPQPEPNLSRQPLESGPERTAASRSDLLPRPQKELPDLEPRKRPPRPRPTARQERPEPPRVAALNPGIFYVRDVLNAIPTPQASTGDGVLSVLADPFGDVSIDGRPYGESPREFRLPAGTYLVRVTHPNAGTREARLTVRAGERARWTADFMKR
ncbi:MAG: hypothetical protein A2V77_10440 [Anaeromyxobacter sp. RBG_16_69_14]|nr:MAG: hypothetical protein A2V77_10440 [Anaeromyxobacter sp. RBG_16_69_14]